MPSHHKMCGLTELFVVPKTILSFKLKKIWYVNKMPISRFCKELNRWFSWHTHIVRLPRGRFLEDIKRKKEMK